MKENSPVIILGAPRSGTSLMQKLIREAPGFVSVPKESDMIWLPHCHPASNDWQYEGCPDSRITDEVIADIRNAFAAQALSASTWRLFDRLGLMERPRLASCLRLGYRALFKPWKRLRESVSTKEARSGRLVDKSVHAGLWLNLVDTVFPNARYIHMVRSPETCIPSMVKGWSLHKRFRTYRIPESVAPARPDTSGWWCFPMPPGWREHYELDLPNVCAFQWNAIQESILQATSTSTFSGRVLRVHLEDLTTQPDTVLTKIADFADLAFLRKYGSDYPLPEVNALTDIVRSDNPTVPQLHAKIQNTYRVLLEQV